MDILTFGGERLLSPNDPTFDSFMVERLKDFDRQTPHTAATTIFSKNSCHTLSDIPLINWPDRPCLGINQFWLPVGATRWSEVFVLADHFPISRNGQTFHARNLSLNFVSTMYCVGYIPFADGVNILRLVDDRFFWQGLTMPATDWPATQTWDALLARINDVLYSHGQITFGSIVPDLYPDSIHLHRPGCPVSALIDAIASSVGGRLIIPETSAISGTQTYEISRNPSLHGTHDLAGVSLGVNVFTDLKMTFPAFVDGKPSCRAPYQVSAAFPQPPRTQFTRTFSVNSTYPANFADISSSTPLNISTLEDICESLAAVTMSQRQMWSDYTSISHAAPGINYDLLIDFSRAQVRHLAISGTVGLRQHYAQASADRRDECECAESHAIFKADGDIPGLSGTTVGSGTALLCTLSGTTIVDGTSPDDSRDIVNLGLKIADGTYFLGHMEPHGWTVDQSPGSSIVVIFVTTGCEPGGSGDGQIQIWNGTHWEDDSDFPDPVDFEDTIRGNMVFEGDLIQAKWSADVGKYEIVGSKGVSQLATLNAEVADGDTVSAVILDSASPSVTVDARNKTGRELASGDKVRIIWDPHRGSDHSPGGYHLGEWIIVATLSVVVPVKLDFVSGDAGDENTQCSFSYDILDPVDDSVLHAGVNITSGSHRWKRPSLGAMVAATWGLAHFDAGTGNHNVFWCNEVLDPEACT